MRNRDILGRNTKFGAAPSRKAQAALALAVSLWIANGGVASAEESVNSNTEINENQSSTVYKLTNDNGVTFSVKSGGDVKAIYSEKNGNTIIVESGGTVSGNKNGSSITGGVSNNTVTIETGATVTERVQGGYTASGAATGNTVIVRGTVNGLVSGGETDFSDGSASGNRVIVDGGTVKDGVYGGYSGTATGNTVELHNAAVTDGAVLGGRKMGSGGDQTTSNKLILSGANTVKLDVENFETIQFDSEKLAWTDGSTVLTARSFSNCGVLDVSAVTEKATTPGTMTLLQATGSNLPAFALSTGDEITAAGVKVVNEAKTDGAGGVTIGYNATHTVALANTKRAITYTVANTVNSITLGSIAWNAGGTVFDGAGYDFATNAVSWDWDNVKNLTFTFADEAAYKSLAPNATMTLISNATGIHGPNADANTTFDYKVANGATLNTKAWGQLKVETDTLTYETSRVDIKSVNLAGWDSTKGAFAIPVDSNNSDVWNPRGNASTPSTNSPVPVTAAGFTAPTTLTAGTSKEIITTNTENFFSDDKITGALKYAPQAASTDTAKGVTFTGSESKGVKASDDGKNLIYARSNFNVSDISLGEMTWEEGRALTGGYDFANTAAIDATKLAFTFTDEQKAGLSSNSEMTLLSGAANLGAGKTVTKANHTQTVNYTVANGAALSGTLTGTVSTAAAAVNYDATGMTLNSVDLTGWNGTTGSVPTGWTSALGNNSITAVSVDGSGVLSGTEKNILTSGTENFFNDNQITDALKYKEYAASSKTLSGVTLTYSESMGVKVENSGMSLVYARSKKNVSNISFGTMEWGMSRVANTGYDYTNITNATIDLSKFTFSNPESISAGGTTTLLVANDTLTAALADVAKDVSYSYAPVAGVTVSGTVNGTLAKSGNNIQYTATANKASKLTFGNVAWAEGGTLMTRPNNITFAGADVDTSNINFTNISALEANKEMTLVANFCDTANDETVGTITGSKYKVGSTLQGEGKASLTDGGNLIFHTDTTAEKMEVQEQTHNTVMGAEVGMAALSVGNDFIASASEGLATPANVGADGVSSFATMGGGSMRQETGSHVDTHTWNAILALGHQNKKERGTFEYGAFFEYGTGNYTTHNGDERGDGSMHYTGGGLLAKWTAKHGLYVEGSLRAGSVHDDARNVLRDVNGVPYSYETNAPYWGAHIGVGKEIALADGNTVDVYGKYYFNRRSGVSFNAGGHYDLDAVTSSVIRLGARYTVNRDKWGLYAGAAYEHELDGKATGTADGMAIRGADTSGGSFRGELGATFKPEKEGPLTLDFNLTGFAGKKQGLTGGVSVSLLF